MYIVYLSDGDLNYTFGYCQAQPPVPAQFWTELVLLSVLYQPATQPPGIVYFSANL